jgi:hypothetical protein
MGWRGGRWVVLLAALGCGSHQSPSPAAAVPVGNVSNVGRIIVTVAPAVAADREARFQKVDGTSRLATAVETELTKVGRFDRESPRVMDVVVTKYRLRSGASVLMLGMMSGGDMMEVAITVRERDRDLVSYSTGAGSVARGGLDQVSRFERLAHAVAERVVKQL